MSRGGSTKHDLRRPIYTDTHIYIIHYIPLHSIALHYIALHCITLHCITLHCITLHYIALQYITLHTYIYIYDIINTYVYICNYYNCMCVRAHKAPRKKWTIAKNYISTKNSAEVMSPAIVWRALSIPPKLPWRKLHPPRQYKPPAVNKIRFMTKEQGQGL